MLLVDIIAGARPNFIKIAPIISEIKRIDPHGKEFKVRLIHTGQHYDKAMSGNFFEQLRIPEPDINLGVGSGTQSEQTARIMQAYEKVLMKETADLCIVVGDVNSTMACSIAAKKMHVKVAHVEGGIRSGDMTMPEEINRIVTDSISDWFYTTSKTANDFLHSIGKREDQVVFVGNTMIDSLLGNLDRLKKPENWDLWGLVEKNYVVLTLHRPSNVDETENLELLLSEIARSSQTTPVVFPVHPRTAQTLEKIQKPDSILTTGPMGYLEFIYLIKNAQAVVTDSGGITEEATVLGVPCMTLRSSTERPETITDGTNVLVGTNPSDLFAWFKKLREGKWKVGRIPDLWDGKAAKRIVEHLQGMTK